MDECRNENRCRVSTLTCDCLPLCDNGETGPGLMIHGALTRILRLLAFAASLAAFVAGTFFYVQYVRRFVR
jgi:hypothetical protein